MHTACIADRRLTCPCRACSSWCRAALRVSCCWLLQVRLLRSKLKLDDILPVRDKLADALFAGEGLARVVASLLLDNTSCVTVFLLCHSLWFEPTSQAGKQEPTSQAGKQAGMTAGVFFWFVPCPAWAGPFNGSTD